MPFWASTFIHSRLKKNNRTTRSVAVKESNWVYLLKYCSTNASLFPFCTVSVREIYFCTLLKLLSLMFLRQHMMPCYRWNYPTLGILQVGSYKLIDRKCIIFMIFSMKKSQMSLFQLLIYTVFSFYFSIYILIIYCIMLYIQYINNLEFWTICWTKV